MTVTYSIAIMPDGITRIINMEDGSLIATGRNVGTAIENAMRANPLCYLVEIGRNPVGWDMVD